MKYHHIPTFAKMMITALFHFTLSIIFIAPCLADDISNVKVYTSNPQQTINGWGGDIYPSAITLGTDFMDWLLENLPATHLRVMSSYPNVSDPDELRLLRYLNSKNINVIIAIKLTEEVVMNQSFPGKVLDYLSKLESQGVRVQYLSLNEPDAKMSSSFKMKDYIALIEKISINLKRRGLPTKFVGPDTATPNNNFIEKFAAAGGMNFVNVLTYHSYEYRGTEDISRNASIANRYNMPIWVTEQNFLASGGNIFSKDYLVGNIRNLILCLSEGHAEVSLFFSYAWGKEGGVVLFDRKRQEKPIFGALRQFYKNVPVGSKVLHTDSALPSVAFKTYDGIVVAVLNDKKTVQKVKIDKNGVIIEDSIEPMALKLFKMP
jgi:hypothetical protein